MVQTDRAKSAIRAVEILRYFDEAKRPLRLKDICAEFGYPTSSAEELLKALSCHGYLTFDPSERSYLPSTKMADMCSWVRDVVFRNGLLQQATEEIRELSGEIVSVAAVNDLHCELLLTLPHSVPRIQFRAGGHCPIVASSMGRLWLSEESEQQVERIYRRTIARGLIDPKKLPLEAVMDRVDALRGSTVVNFEGSWSGRAKEKPTSCVATVIPVAPPRRRVVLCVGGLKEDIAPKLPAILDAVGRWRETLYETIS